MFITWIKVSVCNWKSITHKYKYENPPNISLRIYFRYLRCYASTAFTIEILWYKTNTVHFFPYLYIFLVGLKAYIGTHQVSLTRSLIDRVVSRCVTTHARYDLYTFFEFWSSKSGHDDEPALNSTRMLNTRWCKRAESSDEDFHLNAKGASCVDTFDVKVPCFCQALLIVRVLFLWF